MQLSKKAKISQAITPTAGAAGTSDINGATLDMANFESLLAIVTFGAITSSAVTAIKLQHGDASDLSDAADVADTSQTVADDDDGDIFYIDLHKPTKRYVRVVVERGTANAVVASAEYLQSSPRVEPVSHAAVVNGEAHVSPVSGTA